MAVPTNHRAVLLAIFVAFGFLFGYDIGVISGCLIMPDFVSRFGQIDSDGQPYLSSSRQSIITSLLSAGTIIGALAQSPTADRYGRRGAIILWSAIFTAGIVIQTATIHSIAQISAGRFVAGLGVGALSAIVPLYNGETAPKSLRGTLLVLYQMQITIGIFTSYLIDLATHARSGAASWRIPVGLQLLWGFILLSGIFFLPESPRHLLGLGREADARAVVAELNSVSVDHPIVQETIDELEFGIKAENEGGKATWIECFSTRNMLWRRTMNGMVLQFIQQLNGQNFYYYYGDTFFKSAGSTLSPYVIQTFLGAVSVAGSIPALYLIEVWGRRKNLLTGSILEAICAVIAAFVGHFCLAPSGTPSYELSPRNRQGGDVLIAFAVLQVFIYAITWGPTPWVYLGESYPLRVRSKCIALGSATNWVWNFLLSLFSPRIAADIGPLILLIFFGVLLFAWVYVYLCIPETKGLSLEEVDEQYRAGVKPWNSAGWRPSARLEHEQQEINVTTVETPEKETKEMSEKTEFDHTTIA